MLRPPVHDCASCSLGPRGRCVFARKAVRAGAVMVVQGEAPPELAFVRSGIVALTTVGDDGAEAWTAIRGPRSLLGAEAMQGAASRSEVRAVTDVELCTASVQTVHRLLADPASARALFQLTVSELLDQRRDIDFRSGGTEARVARLMLALDAPLPKARAASLLGIRAETFSRVLRRFAARGLIDRGAAMRVLDRAALEAIAAR